MEKEETFDQAMALVREMRESQEKAFKNHQEMVKIYEAHIEKLTLERRKLRARIAELEGNNE